MAEELPKIRVFIIEDDKVYARLLQYVAEQDPRHEVYLFAEGKKALENLALRPQIITIDYQLKDTDGETLFHQLREQLPESQLLILSGQSDINIAVRLLKEGAFDYIPKDKETKERLLFSLERAKKSLELHREVSELKAQLAKQDSAPADMEGQSPQIKKVYGLIRKAASSKITISIAGETGTGKEVVAKAIHRESGRAQKPFVAVNMAAVPRELVESELFGHEKGSFTGAIAQKKGKFEEAHGGTIFLDEIGELEMSLQAKLLRALQEMEITRVGGNKPIQLDFRVIVATHRNLATEVQEGRFREDLYYRLFGLPIRIPPLRERGRDILILAEKFLRQYQQANGLAPFTIPNETAKALLKYPFPGNVRELKALMELAAVLSDNQTIQPEDLQFPETPNLGSQFEPEIRPGKTMEDYEREIIGHYLSLHHQNVTEAAKALGLGKSTVYRKLRKWGMI